MRIKICTLNYKSVVTFIMVTTLALLVFDINYQITEAFKKNEAKPIINLAGENINQESRPLVFKLSPYKPNDYNTTNLLLERTNHELCLVCEQTKVVGLTYNCFDFLINPNLKKSAQ